MFIQIFSQRLFEFPRGQFIVAIQSTRMSEHFARVQVVKRANLERLAYPASAASKCHILDDLVGKHFEEEGAFIGSVRSGAHGLQGRAVHFNHAFGTEKSPQEINQPLQTLTAVSRKTHNVVNVVKSFAEVVADFFGARQPHLPHVAKRNQLLELGAGVRGRKPRSLRRFPREQRRPAVRQAMEYAAGLWGDILDPRLEEGGLFVDETLQVLAGRPDRRFRQHPICQGKEPGVAPRKATNGLHAAGVVLKGLEDIRVALPFGQGP